MVILCFHGFDSSWGMKNIYFKLWQSTLDIVYTRCIQISHLLSLKKCFFQNILSFHYMMLHPTRKNDIMVQKFCIMEKSKHYIHLSQGVSLGANHNVHELYMVSAVSTT